MKEKILFIAGSILVLLVVVIYVSNNSQKEIDPRAEEISSLLKAGLDLKSEQFCSGLTPREQKRITQETNKGLKRAGIKEAASCQEAFNKVAVYQNKVGASPKTLAVSTVIIEEKENQLLFASSSCSIEGTDDQRQVQISPIPLVGRAIVVNGKILIDSVNLKIKPKKGVKEELNKSLLEINSSCA